MLEGLPEEGLPEFLRSAMNQQGYLLQEACAKAIRGKEGRDFCWRVEAEEYPVSLRGVDSRIDIVLEYRSPWVSDIFHMYAVIECKRADPAYVCWVFGSPDLTLQDAEASVLGYRADGKINPPKPFVSKQRFGVNCYCANWWLEAKDPRKSETGWVAKNSNPQNVENAIIQVLKGSGGLATQQYSHRFRQNKPFQVLFVPVVITTAPLYVAGYKVADIALSSGTLDRDKVSFGPGGIPDPQPWIQVQYGAGESVTAEPVDGESDAVEPRKLLQDFKTRSIFVVNSVHLVGFFSKLAASLF